MKLKKFLSALVSGAMILGTLAAVPVFAADTLPEAVDGVITLTEDVTLAETLSITSDTTINLAGHNITSADVVDSNASLTTLIDVQGATLTINGTGTIEPGSRTNITNYIDSFYTISASNGATVIIDGVTVKGSKGINTKYGGTAVNASEANVTIQNGAKIYGGDCEKNGITSENYANYAYKYQGEAGDAVYAWNSPLTVTDSYIYGGNGTADNDTQISYIDGGSNQAAGGLGICAVRADTKAVVSKTTVKGGDSTLYNAENGVYVGFGANLTVKKGCTITGGSCLVRNGYGIAGAGISVPMGECEVTVTDSTVKGGSTDDSWIGSGIDVARNADGSTVKVEGSEIIAGSGNGKSDTTYAIETATPISVELKDTTLVANSANGKAVSAATGSVIAEGMLTVDGGTLNTEVFTNNGVTISGDDSVTPKMVVAKIGNTNYASLQDAITAAQYGDTITLLKDGVGVTGFTANKSVTIDLNGHNAVYGASRAMVKDNATLTYQNGTIDLTGANDSEAFFETNAHLGTPGRFVFKDMTITGDGYNAGYAVIYVQYPDSSLLMDNVTVDLKHDAGTSSGFIKSEGSAYNKVTIKNSTIALDDTYRGMVGVDVDIDKDTTITAKNSPKTFFRNAIGTVNGKVTVDNYEFAVENEAGTLTFGADANINFLNCTGSNILLTDDAKVLFESGAKANYDVTAYAAAGLAWDAKDNTVKTLSAVLENNKNLTDTEITTIIEDVTVENSEQAAEIVETIKAIDKDVQKEITPEKVEEIINAQNTDTELNEATEAAGFAMDDTIEVSVEEKADTEDVNVVLTSGANNKVYDVKVLVNRVEQTETSTPVLIKIKTDKKIDKILHEHNGTVKEIPFTQPEDNSYVMFTMNEFSNVALVPIVSVLPGQAKLSFVPQASQSEGKVVYDVVLAAEAFATVQNMVSGEFVTQLTGNGTTPLEYVIESVKDADNKDIFDITYIEQAGGTRLYKINLKEFDKYSSYTIEDAKDTYDNGIILGTMTVDGYGSGSVVVKEAGLKMYKHDGSDENLVADINTIPGETATFNIAVPTKELSVNVTFNNTVENNAKAYQDMTLTITGGDLAEPIVYNLGTDGVGVVWDTNKYTIKEDLTMNNTYTVTVSGAGYRTARYTVNMKTDKVLNFWNNVKDLNNAEVIEVGTSDENKVTKNFLAGDIVKDNNINIYDLSAVVSYFGTDNLVTAHPEYARYDLNRDGKIDSKDVAYVLVSWNN